MSALVDSLKTAVAAAISNSASLKSKLDAAVADNALKAAELADLHTQLVNAQAAAADPADAAAIAQIIQELADSTAATNPAN